MNANKLFSEFSIKKIWDKILKHDKAMSSTLLILTSGNWAEQEDGTFKNTVAYATFKDTDKLTVDLYDDGKLSDTQLTEYEQYIDGFEIINGALIATANTKPTNTMTLVVKGDFESSEATVSRELLEDCFQSVSEGKELLASVLTDKKVPTDATATFAEIAANIENLKLGSGNAIASDVKKGKTFTNSDGVEYTGTYDFALETAATAVASQLTKGYTAWVNGVLITGTRPALSTAQSGSLGFGYQYEGHSITHNVTFNPEFDSVPKVEYTISTAGAYQTYTMSNITRKGFIITGVATAGAWNNTVHWTATV